MFTITIKTNRIYFESYPAPCGEPEDAEIRQAWEAAAIDTIESAGYKSCLKIGVGHDRAIQATFDYQTRAACEDCDDCAAEELWDAAIAIIRRDAQRVAEDAISAADKAAQALSDQFVAQSEATENEED